MTSDIAYVHDNYIFVGKQKQKKVTFVSVIVLTANRRNLSVKGTTQDECCQLSNTMTTIDIPNTQIQIVFILNNYQRTFGMLLPQQQRHYKSTWRVVFENSV